MIITATELKTNIGRYLELAEREEIVITRNGKRIAKLVDANRDKPDIVRSLRGILPSNATVAKAKEGRLARQ